MFVIPVNHGDLLLGTKDRFNVAEETKPGRVKVATLISRLENVRDTLKQGTRRSCLEGFGALRSSSAACARIFF